MDWNGHTIPFPLTIPISLLIGFVIYTVVAFVCAAYVWARNQITGRGHKSSARLPVRRAFGLRTRPSGTRESS